MVRTGDRTRYRDRYRNRECRHRKCPSRGTFAATTPRPPIIPRASAFRIVIFSGICSVSWDPILDERDTCRVNAVVDSEPQHASFSSHPTGLSRERLWPSSIDSSTRSLRSLGRNDTGGNWLWLLRLILNPASCIRAGGWRIRNCAVWVGGWKIRNPEFAIRNSRVGGRVEIPNS